MAKHRQSSSISLNQIKQIFLKALDVPSKDRITFIEGACEQHPDCIRQTLELLQRHFSLEKVLLDSTLEEWIADIEEQLGSLKDNVEHATDENDIDRRPGT